MKRVTRFRITQERAGGPVLDFLVQRFSYHSRDEWLDRLASGRVTVNGMRVAGDWLLRAGDWLEYAAHDLPEPVVNTEVGILWQDRDVVVVNKPANLPCHPGGRYFNHTLWAVLKERFGLESPAFINRLDRETSGVMLVACGEKPARLCRAQFGSGGIRKRYLALVEGSFPDSVDATGWVGTEPGAQVRKRQVFCPAPPDQKAVPSAVPGGEWSETRLRCVTRLGELSLVEAEPRTGRLHQIRATLLGLGFPVVGDKLYGVDPGFFLRFCKGCLTEEDRCRMRMDRQALHSAELTFRHPLNHRVMTFEAPLPPDMAAWVTPSGGGPAGQ
jgi:23S rRNA pseudouridine955/2504/2580 synthase/23S rRNA pseudouridine1911/1915/1917 synthase